MVVIPNRFDAITGQRYTNVERLEMTRRQVKNMERELMLLEAVVCNVSDDIDNENLANFAKAVDTVSKALENAKYFGYTGFTPHKLETYHWVDKEDKE